jgi:hypothetical protein
VRAYFLAAASANLGNYQGAQISGQALAALETLHAKHVAASQKEIPGLGSKLDLVLRDVSVGQALASIAKAAQLKIRLIEGSLEDSAEMLAGRAPRITYLDLRGATAAQALDWLLQPLRLEWQPELNRSDGAILVGSDRRMPRSSAWVHDVSTIALPAKKDCDSAGDWKKAVAQARQDAEKFVGAVRKVLQASDKEVMWFAPGQLLVIGGPRDHARVADVIAKLSDPNASLAGAMAALQKVTSQRAKQRREQVEKQAQFNRLMDVAAAHDEYDWKLLAAALGGKLDLEALTELQIAWKADATQKLLDGKGAVIAIRSAWAVTTASRVLSDEKELAALAKTVSDRCRPAAEKALAALTEKPQDVATVLAAVYAALTISDEEFRAKVLAVLPDSVTGAASSHVARLAARGLLGDSTRFKGEELVKVIAEAGVVGEDVMVLVAMACHRAGGDTWTAFRAQMRDLLGDQPLPGSVVVLINRLPGSDSLMAMK